MTCDQVKEHLEAYSLGILELDEQVVIQAHLATCPDCQRLVAELSEVAHHLPQALGVASSLRPPVALKRQILRSLALKSGAPAAQTVIDPVKTRPVTSEAKSGRLWRRSKPVRATIALLAMLLVAITIFLGARLSNVLAQERALRAQLANLVDQQELVLEVIDSDKTVRRVLLAPEPDPNDKLPIYGKLFTRTDLSHVVAMVARLPAPPSGQAYHMWLTHEGQTELGGLMTVNDEGFGLLVFEAHRDGPEYDMVQLTLQPIDSPAPSGETILSWEARQ